MVFCRIVVTSKQRSYKYGGKPFGKGVLAVWLSFLWLALPEHIIVHRKTLYALINESLDAILLLIH